MTVFVAIQCREGRHAPSCTVSGCRCPCHGHDIPRVIDVPAPAASTALCGPDQHLGWLAPQLNELINADFAKDFPEGQPRAGALIVLAPFWCGMNLVRIQNATGLPWRIVCIKTKRLIDAGIWQRTYWHAMWADPKTPPAESHVEFVLHVLVADGKIEAERADDGTFRYRRGQAPHSDHRIKVTGFQCERCRHRWIPRKKTSTPKVCPKCKSPYWDRPKGQRRRLSKKP